MSSAPGVVLNANGTNVKEDAHKITEGNMPLFFPCPCGWECTCHAQVLLRVYSREHASLI